MSTLFRRNRTPPAAVTSGALLPFADTRASPIPVVIPPPASPRSYAPTGPPSRTGRPTWPSSSLTTFTDAGYGQLATVYRCVNVIANAVATAPVKVYRDADGEPEELPDHPLRQLLRFPNAAQSESEWLGAMTKIAAVTGFAVSYKVRAGARRVVELQPLRSDWLFPVPRADALSFDWEYRVPGIPPIPIMAEDVVAFVYEGDPRLSPTGAPPLAAALREIGIAGELAGFVKSFFERGAVPYFGLLLDPEADFEPAEAEALRQRFMERSGLQHSIDPVILQSIKDVKRLGIDLNELAASEIRNMTQLEITSAFGVPPIMVGIQAGLDASTYCLPADARVWTPNGAVTINRIKPGDLVWSLVDGAFVPRPVLRSGKTGHTRLYEVRTKNRTLVASANHPVLTRVPGNSAGPNSQRGASMAWVPVGDLRVGDRIMQPKVLPDQGGTRMPDGSAASVDLLRFCGAIVGDGTLGPRGRVIIAMPTGDRCAAAYRETAERLFVKRGGDAVITKERGRSFAFESATAVGALVEMGFGGRAHTKRVPGWVHGLSRDLRLAFLAGIVDSDGSVDKRGALTFGFCNEALTHDVRDLLIGVGIQCCNVAYRIQLPDRLPQGGTKDVYHFWSVTASSARQLAAIPFLDPVYRARVEANTHRHKEDGAAARNPGLGPDVGAYAIVSIRALDEEDVYDIEVEDGHSFIADGVIVHNSNYGQARRAFYEDTISPLWSRLDGALSRSLLPEFATEAGLDLTFDLAAIPALRDDEDAAWARANLAIAGGWATVADARRAVGLPDVPGTDVFLRSIATVEVTSVSDGGGARARQAEPFAGTTSMGATRRAAPPSETRAAMAESNRATIARIAARHEPEIAQYFREQGERVLAAATRTSHVLVGVVSNGHAPELRALDAIDWQQETRILTDILSRLYLSSGVSAATQVSAMTGVGVSFELSNRWVQGVMDRLALRVTGITDTTRSEIGQVVGKALDEGVSAPQLAERLTDLYSGFSESRAMTIALSESATAFNTASVQGYRESGVVSEVEMIDNPGHSSDPRPPTMTSCADRNGKVIPLAQADAYIASMHPRCVLTLVPLLTTSPGDA